MLPLMMACRATSMAIAEPIGSALDCGRRSRWSKCMSVASLSMSASSASTSSSDNCASRIAGSAARSIPSWFGGRAIGFNAVDVPRSAFDSEDVGAAIGAGLDCDGEASLRGFRKRNQSRRLRVGSGEVMTDNSLVFWKITGYASFVRSLFHRRWAQKFRITFKERLLGG